MNFPIEALRDIRAFALKLSEDMSEEALNAIPAGFNNNVIWNLGHLVAAEQGILFIRNGLEPGVAMPFIQKYMRGTRPEGVVGPTEIGEIRALLAITPGILETALAAGSFDTYKAWTTPYGVELRTTGEALQFLLFHEGLHCGYIMALKRALGQHRQD